MGASFGGEVIDLRAAGFWKTDYVDQMCNDEVLFPVVTTKRKTFNERISTARETVDEFLEGQQLIGTRENQVSLAIRCSSASQCKCVSSTQSRLQDFAPNRHKITPEHRFTASENSCDNQATLDSWSLKEMRGAIFNCFDLREIMIIVRIKVIVIQVNPLRKQTLANAGY
ncbi:hypothetical protein ACFE04_026193 [Oxalis oulophora]